MDEGDRFAPPGARVADVVEGVGHQPVRLWPPNGRMGRLRLLAYGSGLYLGLVVVRTLLGVAAGMTQSADTALVVGAITLGLYVVAAAILLIQRSHDMDLSGWWSIVAFIPLIGLFWLFKGGTPGVNRWGAPPPPNGWSVRILGLILPTLFVLGIVAAIALPAYVDYTKRAQSGIAR